jgi:uncharacterized protein YbjT (DUF2867 family)
MITVMGATGRVGGAVGRRLLAAGVGVRALGRSEARLAELAAAGAQPMMGDAGDAEFLVRAFDGADAVFTMLPFDPSAPDYQAHQARLGEAIIAAIRDSGVESVVALSSIGADVPAGTGVLTSLHAQEQRLRALDGPQVMVLRPGSFFESFAAAVPAIEQEGAYADVFAPELPIPMVAVRDVAAAGATALATRGWRGYQVRELPGPRDLSYAQATSILGAHLGRPDAGYVQVPAHEAGDTLGGYGFSADAARHYVEFARALEEGVIRQREVRRADSSRGMSFEAFAAELAATMKPA